MSGKGKLLDKLFMQQDFFDSYEVEVDFWENQRYNPISGWSASYLGSFPAFSNLFGDAVVVFDQLDQLPCLPAGWGWVEEKWTVDVPQNRREELKAFPSRGETDADGWSYGPSFESLTLCAQNRMLQVDRTTLSNICRRRRWRRCRKCVHPVAKKIEAYRREQSKKASRNIDVAVAQTSRLAAVMQEFHFKWRNGCDTVLRQSAARCDSAAQSLVFLRAKLLLLKDCLHDFASIEDKYARKLTQFATKWQAAGRHTEHTASTKGISDLSSLDMNGISGNSGGGGSTPSLMRRLSTSIMGGNGESNFGSSDSGDTDGPQLNSANVAGEHKDDESGRGFFGAVSRMSAEIATHKTTFANSLSTLLPQDIDRALQQLDEVIEDLGTAVHTTRTQLLQQKDTAEDVLAECVACAYTLTRHLSLERACLLDSLHVVPASTWDATSEEVPPMLNAELAASENDSSEVSGGGAISSTGISGGVSVGAPTDSWLQLLCYGQTLVQANAAMLLLRAQSAVFERKVTQQQEAVSQLLRSLVKCFAHEHFKCFGEAQAVLIEALREVQQISQSLSPPQFKVSPSQYRMLKGEEVASGNQDTSATIEMDSILEQHSDNIRQLPQKMVINATPQEAATNNADTTETSTAAAAGSLSLLLPFLPLYRQSVVCVVPLRFLCLTSNGVQTSSNNSGSSAVAQWKWQRGIAVVTQARKLHILAAPLMAQTSEHNNVSASDGQEGEAEDDANLDEDVLQRHFENNLDAVKICASFSLQNGASVLPLMLTTSPRYANCILLRLGSGGSTCLATPVPAPDTPISSSFSSYLMPSPSSSSSSTNGSEFVQLGSGGERFISLSAPPREGSALLHHHSQFHTNSSYARSFVKVEAVLLAPPDAAKAHRLLRRLTDLFGDSEAQSVASFAAGLREAQQGRNASVQASAGQDSVKHISATNAAVL